jgi:hypothetical protein
LNVYDLKKYIIENNLVFNILNKLNCYNIKEYTKEFRCGLPNDTNSTRVSVNKQTLYTRIFLPDEKRINGDIFSLIMYIKNINFPNSNKEIHNILDLKYIGYQKKVKDNKKDPLFIFKKIRNRSKFNTLELEIYNEEIISEYIQLPHIDWIREGIMPWTCEKFNIGYSQKNNRIVIPHRYWSGDENNYIGIMGRTTIKNYKLFDIPKYYPLKNSFPKSMNLYGLQENYNSIQKKGYVVVFESEKSVLKRDTLLDETCVALCCHDLSEEQFKILLSLNVEVIIALDKGISLNHIRSICDKFYQKRKISYIYDRLNLLKDKESPADTLDKIYRWLLKYRIKYDEKERREYQKCLEKHQNK